MFLHSACFDSHRAQTHVEVEMVIYPAQQGTNQLKTPIFLVYRYDQDAIQFSKIH